MVVLNVWELRLRRSIFGYAKNKNNQALTGCCLALPHDQYSFDISLRLTKSTPVTGKKVFSCDEVFDITFTKKTRVMAEVESTEPSDSGKDKKKEEDESVPGRVFSRDAPPILHLLVVGFHHKKGYVMTYDRVLFTFSSLAL